IPAYPYLDPAAQGRPFNGHQPNSATRSDGQAFGASRIFDGGYVGIAISQFNSLYHVPGLDDAHARTRQDMHPTKVTSKGEFRSLSEAVDTVKFWLGATDYKHDEIGNEGGFNGVQQSFTNKSQEAKVEVALTPTDLRFAKLNTTFGVQAANQDLT